MKKVNTYLILALVAFLLSGCNQATTETEQYYYQTQQQAADALYKSLKSENRAEIRRVLGANYVQLIPEEFAKDSVENVKTFLTAWNKFNGFVVKDNKKVMIEVGNNHWTFPVPIIKEAKGWRFDTVEGLVQIYDRHIGRNELAAMQASLAYGDAQQEYILYDYDDDGVLEYAQVFRSNENSKNGLFWETADNEKQSPLGPLFDDVTPSGAYYGYYYKILNSQGDKATGGAHSYLINGNMVSGFALIAWPAEYGVSGVMSFKLNNNGILYESDLGPDTHQSVKTITAFNPDDNWKPIAKEFL